MVYSVILAVVIGVVASIYLSLNTTQGIVSTKVQATSQAQLAADSIETGVRNSSAYSLTAPTVSTQLLQARVATGTTSVVWKCAAWYYSTSKSSLYYKTSATAIAAPTTATLSSWTLLATGVSPVTGATIFSSASQTVSFSFSVDTGNESAATVSSSAVQRAGLWVSSPCF
jgi:hypothetical protein